MSIDETLRRRELLASSGLLLVAGCAGIQNRISRSTPETERAETSFDQVWGTSSRGNISPATLVDDRLYVGTTERETNEPESDVFGSVRSFDLTDNSERWSTRTRQPIAVKPRVGHGHVYVGTEQGVLHAFSTEDGTTVWEYDAGTGLTDTSIAVGENTVYLGGDAGGLVAVNATTGELRWNVTTKYEKSVPVRDDESLYVGAGDFGSATTSDNRGVLFALDPENGAVRWKTPVAEPVVAPPAVSGEQIHTVGDTRGGIFAFDTGTGEKQWTYRTHTSILAPPAAVNDVLHVGTTGGQVYALSVSDGTERWTFEANSAIRAPLAVTSNGLYVGDNTGSVYKLDRSSGEERSKFAVEYDYVTSIGVRNHSVYAVSNESIGVGAGRLCEYRRRNP